MTFGREEALVQAANKKHYNDVLRAGWERRSFAHRFVPESGANMGMKPYRGLKPSLKALPSAPTAADPLYVAKGVEADFAGRPKCVAAARALFPCLQPPPRRRPACPPLRACERPHR